METDVEGNVLFVYGKSYTKLIWLKLKPIAFSLNSSKVCSPAVPGVFCGPIIQCLDRINFTYTRTYMLR